MVPSLNACLSFVTGEFVARMDSDDVAEPTRFERQLEYLRSRPDCVAVGSNALWIDGDGDPICRTVQKLKHEEIDEELLSGRGLALMHSTSMLRRDALERCGGYHEELPIGEDLDLFLRLAEIGRLANLPDVLMRYRRSVGSASAVVSSSDAARVRRVIFERARNRRGPDCVTRDEYSQSQREDAAELHARWARAAFADGFASTGHKYVRKLVCGRPWDPMTYLRIARAYLAMLNSKRPRLRPLLRAVRLARPDPDGTGAD
jgi:GT2 family glycosyltransferase